MKKFVWLAGLLLLVSFVFPRGLPLPVIPTPVPGPVSPDVPPAGPTDAKIVELLTNAPASDKARIRGIYLGLLDVVKRDSAKSPADKKIKTTEHWSAAQAATLNLATDGTQLKGKYVGLDVAIEAVFDRKLGADREVVSVDAATSNKIIEACTIVADSAR
jgi:hypothetical protein